MTYSEKIKLELERHKANGDKVYAILLGKDICAQIVKEANLVLDMRADYQFETIYGLSVILDRNPKTCSLCVWVREA